MEAVTRRQIIRGLSPIACMCFITRQRQAIAQDGSSQASKTREVHRQLMYAENEQPAYWWLKGRKYGVLDGKVTHLWDISTGIMSQGSLQQDGSFNTTVFEAFFQFVPNTETLMENWTNPYTGENTQVSVFPSSPSENTYKELDSTKTVQTPLGAMTTHAVIHSPRILGDTVWLDISENIEIRNDQQPAEQGAIRINEWLSYSAHMKDWAADYGFRHARCDLDIWSDWTPNMNMAGYPGGLLTRAQGQKLTRYDAYPKSFRDLFSEHFPDVAADPTKFIRSIRGT